MVPLGIAQAAVVRVALHLGAGGGIAAARAGRTAIALAGIFMLAMSVLMIAAPLRIIGLYLDTAAPANLGVVPIAVSLILIAALFQVLDGVQVVAVGALRGYRDTAVPMLLAAFGYWVIGFPGGWALAFPLGWGPTGLWWGLALGLTVVAVALLLRLESRARSETETALPAAQPAL
jgi:MATE family multidrug resistance protein